jgi:hypothetical protein
MKAFRAIFVALIALSVAAVPAAGGIALAAMSHDMTDAGDCCHEGQPCKKKTDDCGSMAGCALKCFNYSAVVMAPHAVQLTFSSVVKSAFIVPGVPSPSDNPPLPPPRV